MASEERVTIRLLRQELESWRPFVEALRLEDRQVARAMMENCWRYAEAIEASGKDYLTEPFFLALLLAQERKIRSAETLLEQLRAEVEDWKSKAGS